MANDPPEQVQRWTAKRRVALVVSFLKGETSVQQAARKHGPTVAEVEDWQERFLLAAENGLRVRPKDEEEEAVVLPRNQATWVASCARNSRGLR